MQKQGESLHFSQFFLFFFFLMQKILKGLTIYKIWYGGIGIARLSDGKKVLIKGGALPWSIVDVRVVKSRKDYVEAHLLEIKKQNPELLSGKAICQHFFSPFMQGQDSELQPYQIGCWGCKWQVMNYESQLNLKSEIVKDAFGKLAKKQEIWFLPIVASPLQEGYRNKIEFSFGVYKQLEEAFKKAKKSWSSEEELLAQGMKKYAIDSDFNLGFHKQGEFSKIVDVSACGLISQKANQIFSHLKALCKDSGLAVYDQKTHQGFFRHLVIREGVNTGQVLVNLSVADNNLASHEQTQLREHFLEKIKADPFLQEQVSTLVISYNNGLADIVRNAETEIKTFWGEGMIYENLDFSAFMASEADKESEATTVNFRISPSSFFQTNTLGAQRLFWTAMKMIGRIEGNVLDLYCGAGSIGLSLLKMGIGNELVGVEIVEEAIVDAWHNAKINGLEARSFFVASPAEKMLINFPELQEKIQNVGLVVIDPPREGLHPNVIKYLADLKRQYAFKLLYISCNPITMARDIELLVEEGFSFKQVQPVDLFAHTHHIECISVLY